MKFAEFAMPFIAIACLVIALMVKEDRHRIDRLERVLTLTGEVMQGSGWSVTVTPENSGTGGGYEPCTAHGKPCIDRATGGP